MILTSDYTSMGDYTLRMDSTSYVTIKGISIQKTGSSTKWQRVIEIGNKASHLTFSNNSIIGISLNSGGYYGADLIYSDISVIGDNVFLNNRMKWGYRAFNLQGNPRYRPGTIIEGNIIDSVAGDGIAMKYQDSPVIRKNYIKTYWAAPIIRKGLWFPTA